MAKYRKKPVVIDATQWDGTEKSARELVKELGLEMLSMSCDGKGDVTYWKIGTLEGGHEVTPGDWIITGIKGEHYPCKPDIFAATYEDA